MQDISLKTKFEYTALYVEDDDAVRNALLRPLGLKFEKVLEARDGVEGLEIFKKEKPDVVITDIKMPRMTGIELSEIIKSISPSTPILITTAFNDSEFLVGAINCGVDKFVTKPVEMPKLFAMIDELCTNIRLRDESKKQEKLLQEYKKAADLGLIVSKTDRDGLLTFVNDRFCEISGYGRSELIGKHIDIIRHPNTHKEVMDEILGNILCGRVWEGVVENRAKNGGSFWVEKTVTPITDENANMVETIEIGKDITALVMHGKELERAKAAEMREGIDKAIKLNLKKIIALNPLPALIVDENDAVVCHNEALEGVYDPFADMEIIEKIRNKKASVVDLFLEGETLFGGSGSALDWKEILASGAIDEILETKSGKGGEKFFPKVFGYEDNKEKFWIIYLLKA